MKPRGTGGKREIRDADKVAVVDRTVMLLQSIERTPQQAGIDPSIEILCSSESQPGSGGSGRKGANGKIDKKTAGKYQDIELRRKYAWF